MLAALDKRGWTLSHVLITHHHWDHVAGLEALLSAAQARVIGAADDAHRLPPLDTAVREGDAVHIGNEAGNVISVPGHTVGHIAYHFPQSAVVFTADSLMALGCGRLFEGTAGQMWDSLSKLAALPPETMVCSGHEYTLNNAKFAITVDPENPALKSRLDATETARAQDRPTVPSTLSEELATNPFLRADEPALKRQLGMPDADAVDVFAEIRRRKDAF